MVPPRAALMSLTPLPAGSMPQFPHPSSGAHAHVVQVPSAEEDPALAAAIWINGVSGRAGGHVKGALGRGNRNRQCWDPFLASFAQAGPPPTRPPTAYMTQLPT